MLLSFRTPALMAEKQPIKRKNPTNKKWHQKVRSGCMRCKIRRVKCDEERPECHRCRKARLKCGYNVPKTKVFSIDDGLLFDDPGDKRFYDFFVNEGSRLLTTFQPSQISVWRKLAAQLSRTHPAVQYGLTALGAVQAPLHYGVPRTVVETKPPEVSPKAISYLVKSMSYLAHADPDTVTTEVSITCCLAYMAMTIWMERAAAPVIHTDAGLQMLRDYQEQVAKDPLRRSTVIEEGFVGPFTRFVVNACAFSDNYPTPTTGIPENYCLDIDLDSTGYLLNFTDAYDAVNTVLKCIFRFNEGVTCQGISGKVDRALNQLSRSLDELHTRDVKTSTERGQLETANLETYLHLKVHHRFAFIMFHARKAGNEMDYDLYQDDFSYIVTQSSEQLARAQGSNVRHAGNLTTTLGIIPPLFFTATKCRNSPIRTQAINLLHTSLQTERGWTNCMATSIARFVIDTEEADLAMVETESVPLERRICLEHVEHSSANGLSYIQYRYAVGDVSIPNHTSTLPYRRHLFVEADGVTIPMGRKVLHAYGYTGVMLFTPRVSCHCPLYTESLPSVTTDETFVTQEMLETPASNFTNSTYPQSADDPAYKQPVASTQHSTLDFNDYETIDSFQNNAQITSLLHSTQNSCGAAV